MVLLLFWKRTTRQGVIASVLAGLSSSLAYLSGSAPAFQNVYGLTPAEVVERAWVPFSHPAPVTLPLAFVALVALVVVSILTKSNASDPVNV